MKQPTIPVERWKKEIDAARRRREPLEERWAEYARLHTNAYLAVREKNDAEEVVLPNGDQVKLGLVHSNIEQTLGLLEVPEIGVRATTLTVDRELGQEDTHREAVVEAGLYRSLLGSGLVKGTEETDFIKRDAVIVGHGICYTHWRLEEEEVELDPVAVMNEVAPGQFEEAVGEDGLPEFEYPTEKQVVYEAVQDEHVSPLEFLFAADAKSIAKARWHGMEKVVPLETLRADPRFEVPSEITPRSFRRKDLYGVEPTPDEIPEADSVLVVVVYDKRHRELIHFIETTAGSEEQGKKGKQLPEKELVVIGAGKHGVRFGHPDASPFNAFVPIPANDHPFGVSQVEHIKNPATEADKLRTRLANLTRQIKRIPWYRKGRVDPDQISKAFQGPDAVPVGLDIQEGEKPEQLFGDLPIPSIHTEVFQGIEMSRSDVRNESGISEIPYGGAGTATESENMMAIGGARPNRKRRLYLAFLTRVAEVHRDFLRAFAPEGELLRTMSADGTPLLLPFGREAFQGDFAIEIVAGGGATAVSPVKQKMMMETGAAYLGKFGPEFDLVFLRQSLTMMDARDINTLVAAARKGLMGMAPGAAGAEQIPGQRPEVNLNDLTNGQVIRSAINAPNEG